MEGLKDWQSYFKFSDAYRDQDGTRAAFAWAATVDPNDPGFRSQLFELVTGYGKTLIAYGVFWILMKRGIVSHMLVLVPSDAQRTQFAEDAADAARLLGIDVEAWMVEKKDREFSLVRKGKIRVFVATYQQLGGGFLRDLMSQGGDWLLVCDECHHLADDGQWAKRVDDLPAIRCRIGLSATPIRNDLKSLLGFPDKPNIVVTYKDAYEERVVKRVRGYNDHYFLDVDIDGKRVRITTEWLRDRGIKDIAEIEAEGPKDVASDEVEFPAEVPSRYEAKRQLRYNRSYLDRMLIEPLQKLLAKEMKYPGQNTAIAFCMSCKHADYVCNQFNTLIDQLGMPFVAAWIGVSAGMDGLAKSKEVNDLTKEVFRIGFDAMKPEQRRRCRELRIPTKIDILCQVGKCEEGFSSKKVSVQVFLHLINSEPKNFQQIGRGLRRNEAIPFDDDDDDIYCSADTELAELIRRMEVSIGASRDGDGPQNGDIRIMLIPDLFLIDSRYDRTEFVGPFGPTCPDPLSPEQREICDRLGISTEAALALLRTGAVVPRPAVAPVLAPVRKQDRLKQIDEQVQGATTQLTSNFARVLKVKGIPIEKEEIRNIKISINSEWVRLSRTVTKAMDEDGFRQKFRWLQEVTKKLAETREVPRWVKW